MSLAKKLAVAAAKTNKVRCAVAVTKDGMKDSDEEAAFLEALESPTLSAQVLATVMRGEGFDLSAYSVRRHRRKECSC